MLLRFRGLPLNKSSLHNASLAVLGGTLRRSGPRSNRGVTAPTFLVKRARLCVGGGAPIEGRKGHVLWRGSAKAPKGLFNQGTVAPCGSATGQQAASPPGQAHGPGVRTHK